MIREVVVPPEKQKLIDEMNRYVREVCTAHNTKEKQFIF